jgi:hypothetical protein
VGYSTVNVDDIEGAGPGGAVRFVRRVLGVEAFGINWFEIPPNAAGPEHDELETGQEEVDGTEVPMRVGSFARFDPETTRQLVAGPEGVTMIAVGAPRGSYEARGPF